MSGRCDRHGLVWLNRTGWAEVFARVGHMHRAAVHQWQILDGPLVVRRYDVDCTHDEVCLGIALPPAGDGSKVRIPVRVARSGVRTVRAPFNIAEVAPDAPPRWRSALAAMQADTQGLSFGVFGSLALQALTGQTYLSATSDIDLLFTPDDPVQLQQGMAALLHYAARLPLDGEIVFPGGAAVSWKEWAQVIHGADNGADRRVLAKRHSDVALMRAGDLLATLEEMACRT